MHHLYLVVGEFFIRGLAYDCDYIVALTIVDVLTSSLIMVDGEGEVLAHDTGFLE